MYSYSSEDNNETDEHHKCKGVKTSVINKDLTTQLYKTALFEKQIIKVKQNGFRSYKHQLYTETIEKIALSGNDDKCYINENNITTYNLCHHKIRNDKK